MKKGLILEGGAMLGLFSAGVMDVLMENGIEFDGAVGVSAGAAFGCNYKSKQIGRALTYNTRFCRDKRYSGLGVWLKSGNFYSEDFCFGEVPYKYDIFDFDTYENNPMDFWVVCSDAETGEAVYHKYEGRNDSGFEWIRASCALPLGAKIVEINGQKLLDGAICDSIPVKFFEEQGYDKRIAILTHTKDFRLKPFSPMSVCKWVYRKFPAFLKAVAERHIKYNETADYIEKEEAEGRLFVIRPETKLPVKLLERDPEKLTAAYNQGRETAQRRLEELKEFLSDTAEITTLNS